MIAPSHQTVDSLAAFSDGMISPTSTPFENAKTQRRQDGAKDLIHMYLL